MGELLQPMHLLIIAIVAIILFGGKKLPELGKGLGEGLKGFKDGLKGATEDTAVKPAPPAPIESVQAAPPKPDETPKA